MPHILGESRVVKKQGERVLGLTGLEFILGDEC